MADRKVRRPQPDESDEAPVKKKKKGKKKEEKPRGLMIAAIAGIAVAVLLLLALPIWALVAYSGSGGVKPVTEWDTYSTEENEFGFDYPKGWRTKSYGIRGKREVEVKNAGALITAKENITGSLIGDIAGAGRGALVEDDERSPVAAAHAMRAPKDLPNYQEGKAVTVTSRFGKVRKSPYKDGSKKGYRVTVLMGQTALDVFCECRAGDWDTLQPAFDRVIESLGPGR
jgi:hypothetical protein